jgi:hypothetical protein
MSPSTRFLFALSTTFVATGCGISPEFRDEVEYPAPLPASPPSELAAPAPISEAPISAAEPAGDAAMVGRFEGTGVQSNGPSWPVSVTITDLGKGACAIVRFPDDDCTGYWQCTDVRGNKLRAVERITRGKDKCLDGVNIRARLLPSGELAFVARARGVKAAGTLQRVE